MGRISFCYDPVYCEKARILLFCLRKYTPTDMESQACVAWGKIFQAGRETGRETVSARLGQEPASDLMIYWNQSQALPVSPSLSQAATETSKHLFCITLPDKIETDCLNCPDPSLLLAGVHAPEKRLPPAKLLLSPAESWVSLRLCSTPPPPSTEGRERETVAVCG